MRSTAVTRLIGVELPIVGAPMGGGPSTPELAAAVSEAGGLGSLAAGYLSPDAPAAEMATTRTLTRRPFAINVFAQAAEPVDDAVVEQALQLLEPLRLELGLPARPSTLPTMPVLDAQLDAIIDAAPATVSFTFGLLPPDAVRRLHDAGTIVIGTATTVAEAVALERADTDIVCAQGAEAGAHRGTFISDAAAALIGTVALVPQVCDAVSVPVIAAGGIMDGRGVAAALTLGAGAAQMGTALLRCPEAHTPATHRRALAAADEAATAVSSKITGRMARGIDNRLMRTLRRHEVPPYPVMHTLTSELRKAAAAHDEPQLMSLWAGQGVRLGTELPAGELIGRIAAEAESILSRLGKRVD